MTRRTLNAAPPPGAERIDLVVHYTRGGAPDSETFTIVSDPGLSAVIAWNTAKDKHLYVDSVLRPVMVDDDGLPVTYQTTRGADPVGPGDEAYDERIEDPQLWSSARRWRRLARDGALVIASDQLVAVIDQLVEEATGERPTGGSVPSSSGRSRTKRA